MEPTLQFVKLSDFLKEKAPEVDFEAAKKAVNAYREYMFYLRRGQRGFSFFCDVCYKIITPEEASKTGPLDFHFCCTDHFEYRNHFNLDMVRARLGLEFEHMPMLDIFG